MLYTNPDKTKLLTIDRLVEMIKTYVGRLKIQHLMPYDFPIDGEDKFLLNRTASGRFSLKPNITKQACLYYGTPTSSRPIIPTLWEAKEPNYLKGNVLFEEFELAMESHPIYCELKRGIETSRGVFRIENPYGIATAYGFPSSILPLTSSLDIAAYLATHYFNETIKKWEPVDAVQNGEQQTGYLCFFEMLHQFPMIPGLSSIGLQAFERTGNQRLFGLHIPQGVDFIDFPNVCAFEFRQDSDEAKKIEDRINEMGITLFPEEIIANKADEILRSNRISEEAFRRNCLKNPFDNIDNNRSKLEEVGIVIEKGSLGCFNFKKKELDIEEINNRWKSMCESIIVTHPGFSSILDELKQHTITL